MEDDNDPTKLPEFFDPSQEEGTSSNLLPAGIYLAQIIDAAVSQPQSQDGYGINLTWENTEGEHEGRRVRQRITFQHSSEEAQKIGRREFKDLCDACGITKGFNSVEPLKFIPCKVRVGIEKDKNGMYDDKNKVTRVWPVSKGPPLSSQVSAAPKSFKSPASPQSSPSSKRTSPKSSSLEGVSFKDQWQPPNPSPNPPQTQASSSVTGEVRGMIIGLHTKSGLTPQQISEELAKIDVQISASTIEVLLVAWNKYATTGSSANGGTQPSSQPSPPPQGSPQSSFQPSSPQSSPQAAPQAQDVHGEMPPWRK
jgi:hypothetical protein